MILNLFVSINISSYQDNIDVFSIIEILISISGGNEVTFQPTNKLYWELTLPFNIIFTSHIFSNIIFKGNNYFLIHKLVTTEQIIN